MDWKFETYVEKIKFDVLREIARASYAGNFKDIESKLPEILVPGRKANYRCCVYMERAIMTERIKIARGGEWDDFNIIDVIPIACDQCPMGGYTVTESCRSCIGHACKQACPKGAISIDAMHRAHIDKEKCVNCGLCAKACPFGAIYNFRRPCQKACPTGAITMDENLSAKIDYSKCIACGNCTQKCPFGAITAKTFITFIIDHIRNNILATKKRPIYAIVAPSIAAQFPGVQINQIVEGITKLGFTNVVEAAVGADAVTDNETRELLEKKVLTSSCCPAFVAYIQKFHPELKDKISHNPSPMTQTGKIIKAKYPDALTVFIGPCAAKKDERSKPDVRPYIDYVLTFVELRAMFAARDVEIEKLPGIPLEGASPFGRAFARMGGLSEAVVQALKEQGNKDFKLHSIACSGMRECIKALENLSAGDDKYNFIEGMACEGGCICGPDSLNHNVAVGKAFVSSYGRSSKVKTIAESVKASGANQKMNPHFINQPGLAGKSEANPIRGQRFYEVNQPGLMGARLSSYPVGGKAPTSTKSTPITPMEPAKAVTKPTEKKVEKPIEVKKEVKAPITPVAKPTEKKVEKPVAPAAKPVEKKVEKDPAKDVKKGTSDKAEEPNQTITVAEPEPEKKEQE